MSELYTVQQKKEWIDTCEADFQGRLCRISEELLASGVRLCRLTGPTCSGKTTAAKMIVRELNARGRQAHIVSIDDFYHDKVYLEELSRQKGLKEVDYDSEDTIDLQALEVFVREIFTSDTVHSPAFDFCVGKRVPGRVFQISEEDVFIIEGIQVLYPGVSALFGQYGSFGVFIAPETPVTVGGQVYLPNELRLLRRLVRDFNFRGTSAQTTLKMWQSVRENEEKNIFPYSDDCALHIDSAMPYEIGVLKPYLERILAELPDDSAYLEQAGAILEQIRSAQPISASLIGEDSLYREFV